MSASTEQITVAQLRDALSRYPDDLLVAAIYDEGCAGGAVVAIQEGSDPDENSPAVLLVVR